MKLASKLIFHSVLSSILLSLFSSAAIAQGEIKIGFAGPLTGYAQEYGEAARNGCELAIEEINRRGGVLGNRIELVIEDDSCDPSKAAIIAEKLVYRDNVKAVVGHICSGATHAALPIYKRNNVVVISPFASNNNLTKSGMFPNFFRTTFKNEVSNQILSSLHATNAYKVFPKIEDTRIIEFQNKYTAKFGKDPTPISYNAYAAVQALAYAITQAGELSYDRVISKLRTSSIPTIMGDIRFDSNGDLKNNNYQLFFIKDNKWSPVLVPNPNDFERCKECECTEKECKDCAKCEEK